MKVTERRRRELEAELRRVLPIIVKRYRPERVILYGSLAGGAVKEGSDIDLCVIKRTRKRQFERVFELRKLVDVRKAIDVTVYTPGEVAMLRRRRPSFFTHEVEERGRVLYERPRSR